MYLSYPNPINPNKPMTFLLIINYYM